MGTGASATNSTIKSPVNNPNNKKPDRYSHINIPAFTKEERATRIVNQINQKNILRARLEQTANNTT